MQKMFLKNSTVFVRGLRARNNLEKRDSSFLGSIFGGSSQKNEMSTVQEVIYKIMNILKSIFEFELMDSTYP